MTAAVVATAWRTERDRHLNGTEADLTSDAESFQRFCFFSPPLSLSLPVREAISGRSQEEGPLPQVKACLRFRQSGGEQNSAEGRPGAALARSRQARVRRGGKRDEPRSDFPPPERLPRRRRRFGLHRIQILAMEKIPNNGKTGGRRVLRKPFCVDWLGPGGRPTGRDSPVRHRARLAPTARRDGLRAGCDLPASGVSHLYWAARPDRATSPLPDISPLLPPPPSLSPAILEAVAELHRALRGDTEI